MNRPIIFMIKRFREYLHFLSSIPVLLCLLIFWQTYYSLHYYIVLIPILCVIFYACSEQITSLEIKRTNKILKTQFTTPDKWFNSKFYSISGIKERFTDLRLGMAVLYFSITFGLSVVNLLLIAFTSFLLLHYIAIFGLLLFSKFNNGIEVVSVGEKYLGSISAPEDTEPIVLQFGSINENNILSWDLGSYNYIFVWIGFVILSIFIINRIIRIMANLVEGLLVGSLAPEILNRLSFLKLQPKISKQGISNAISELSINEKLSDLTPREREILTLIAQGKSNLGISKSIYITEKSVEKHVSNILNKLDLPQEENNHRRVLAVLKYLGLDDK